MYVSLFARYLQAIFLPAHFLCPWLSEILAACPYIPCALFEIGRRSACGTYTHRQISPMALAPVCLVPLSHLLRAPRATYSAAPSFVNLNLSTFSLRSPPGHLMTHTAPNQNLGENRRIASNISNDSINSQCHEGWNFYA
ncbi:hypothetical protein BJ912DRAFT_983272 [Pholiota molesta]|nr:hypothetical protein BJ912DRAFT_983272 [Pholiota molesta]